MKFGIAIIVLKAVKGALKTACKKTEETERFESV